MEFLLDALDVLFDDEVIMELDEDLFQELYLESHEEFFLRFCLCVATLGLLYVSLLLHETLLFFCLAAKSFTKHISPPSHEETGDGQKNIRKAKTRTGQCCTLQ